MAGGPKPRDISPDEARQLFTTPGSSLGLRTDSVADTVRQIKHGLSYQKLVQFQHTSRLPMESIARAIHLPKRTMVRRKKSRKLSQDESERLVRLSLVFEKATNLFEGNKAAAIAWLSAPCKALGQLAPLAVAETELGARAVEDLIGQLEHGVFA